jgi:hypothetical protein
MTLKLYLFFSSHFNILNHRYRMIGCAELAKERLGCIVW